MKTLVIIPAYNEEKDIAAVINGVARNLPATEVLVVDDGSTDATAKVARELDAMIISHSRNLGIGDTLRSGYLYAIENRADCVLQIDADGQHDPKDLPMLLQTLKTRNADVVVGSRFLPGSSAYPIPILRRMGMLLFGYIATKKAGIPLTDTTSGYRALSKRAVALCLCSEWKYPDANLLVWLAKSGMIITEIPVTMYGSRGKSMHDGLEPIRYVLNMLVSMLKMKAVKA